VLELAGAMKLLKLGTVSLDSTKLDANASRHSALSHAHLKALPAALDQVDKLIMNSSPTGCEWTVAADAGPSATQQAQRTKQEHQAKSQAKKTSACLNINEGLKMSLPKEHQVRSSHAYN
jgi:hypothetical protein